MSSLGTGYVLYDPFDDAEADRAPRVLAHIKGGWVQGGEIEQKLREVGQRIYQRNIEAKKSNPLVCVAIFRARPSLHSYFKLCPRSLHLPSNVRGEENGGLSWIEALCDGRWRLADIETERERVRQDEEASTVARTEDKRTAALRRVMMEAMK